MGLKILHQSRVVYISGPEDFASPSLNARTLNFNPDALESRKLCVGFEVTSDFDVEEQEFFKVLINNNTVADFVILEIQRARVLINDTTRK